VPAPVIPPELYPAPPHPRAYTPLQVLFLARLARLAALCYYALYDSTEPGQRRLLQQALHSTLDDCFALGLAPDLLALLAEEVQASER